MDCPRCKLSLVRDTYEGQSVERCGQCWGYWLDEGELQSILISPEYEFTEQEASAALKGLKTVSAKAAKNDPSAACPRCGEVMAKVTVGTVIIDRCPGHGVWLDDREIKAIQVTDDPDAIESILGGAGGKRS